MIRLTNEIVFGRKSLPVTVCDAFHVEATGSVQADCVKVVFVTAGWSELSFATGTVQLGPGSIVTIPESIWCAATPYGFARTVTLYVHGAFVDSHLQWLPEKHPLIAHLLEARAGTRVPGVLNVGDGGIQLLRPKLSRLVMLSRTTAGEFATLGRIAEVFDAVALLAGDTSQTLNASSAHSLMTPRRQVTEAAHALHQCLSRAWTMAELAREVAVSESQLTRLFRQDLGISPAAFLWRARADRMAELLTSSGMTVSESARAVGWRNASVASRSFKRRYGLSPRLFVTRAHLPGPLNTHAIEDHPLQAS